MGINDILDSEECLAVKGHPVLVGIGSDGATVNISDQNGIRGKIQNALPWLFWAWCYCHRLELACRDSLSSSLFKEINEMLLRLYYLYEKSPKKCRELLDLVTDLKEVFVFPEGGNLPVRAQGSRWISHKRKALQRVVDRYGAYLHHLQTLVEDRTIKSIDRQRLKGYLLKWKQSKILLGCAMYIDILQSPSILSLTLQDDNIDVALGIKSLLKSHSTLKKLSMQDPLQWSSTTSVISKFADDDSGGKMYQGITLQRYNEATIATCKHQVLADLTNLDDKMRSRLEWSDLKILRSILLILGTQNWQMLQTKRHSDSESEDGNDPKLCEVQEAVITVTEMFRMPLEAQGADLSGILDETEDAVLFARSNLSIQKDNYKRIWYLLHVAPEAVNWKNLLLVTELLFSLPFSTAKVERLFSMLKIMKTEKRTALSITSVNDLMEINTEGPSLSNFNAEAAVSLWWNDCATTRRVNQRPRKKYRKRKSTDDKGHHSASHSSSSEVEQEALALDVWDTWFEDGSDIDVTSEVEDVDADNSNSEVSSEDDMNTTLTVPGEVVLSD